MSTKFVLVFVALFLSAVFAYNPITDAYETLSTFPSPMTSGLPFLLPSLEPEIALTGTVPQTIGATCYVVGTQSGCSGCDIGTQGLCSWIHVEIGWYYDQIDNEVSTPEAFPAMKYSLDAGGLGYPPYGPTAPNPEAVVQLCVPSEDAEFLETAYPGEITIRNDICPVDPTQEPVFTEPLLWTDVALESESGSATVPKIVSLPVQSASTLLSSYHNLHARGYNGKGVYAVDRTSLWGSAGFMRWTGWAEAFQINAINVETVESGTGIRNGDQPMADIFAGINCAYVNSVDRLFNPTAMFVGALANNRSQFCTQLYAGALLATRCPRYGVAVSGLCQSFYELLDMNCDPTNVVAEKEKWATYAFPYWFNIPSDLPGGFPTAEEIALIPIAALPVVPDTTLFCLNYVPLIPDGEFQNTLGFSSWGPGAPFAYDET